MPWEFHLHPEHPVIEATYSGLLGPAELSDSVKAFGVLARESGRGLLLSDCTSLEGGHTLLDLYGLADIILSSGESRLLQREALILPELPDSAEKVGFWETVCYNRGLDVRVFKDRGSALEWLLKSKAS